MNESPVGAIPPPERKTALIADSYPEVNELLASVFRKAEWTVTRVPDNSELLRMAKNQPYDLIITGGNTPGKEDVELLQQIRQVRPHVRLIILADESTPADVIASMRERAFSYFSQPFSLDSMEEMVRTAMEQPFWDDGIEVLSGNPLWTRIICRCVISTANRLVQFVKEISDLPEEESNAVGTAFREMLLNAIEHGGHFDERQYVEIAYLRTKQMVMCRVKDPGQGFSLDELKHAAISNPPDDPFKHIAARDSQGLRPGGFGVLLARQLVDELIYSEKGNEVLLIKYLGLLGNSAHQEPKAHAQ